MLAIVELLLVIVQRLAPAVATVARLVAAVAWAVMLCGDRILPPPLRLRLRLLRRRPPRLPMRPLMLNPICEVAKTIAFR